MKVVVPQHDFGYVERLPVSGHIRLFASATAVDRVEPDL
jgi:hypothetical protein